MVRWDSAPCAAHVFLMILVYRDRYPRNVQLYEVHEHYVLYSRTTAAECNMSGPEEKEGGGGCGGGRNEGVRDGGWEFRCSGR